MSETMQIQIIDSHTGGEPTRIVVAGGPTLIGETLAQQRACFREHFDHIRSAVVNEPRGSDVLVGALLCAPTSSDAVAGVLFFNNVGMINMCGHGTIGLAVTLAHMGKIGIGTHKLDTSVGTISFTLETANQVTIENVPSYRYRKAVVVDVPGVGEITGDIAWGGNWFFLVNEHGQDLRLQNVEQLTHFTWSIRQSLERYSITGKNNELIDHIELFSPSPAANADSVNFVLCPGKAYDRSPCGTGTSAKLACLYEDGKLKPGDSYRQASILGSVFSGQVRLDGNQIIPKITGSAFVTAEATLILNPNDPFVHGIRPL